MVPLGFNGGAADRADSQIASNSTLAAAAANRTNGVRGTLETALTAHSIQRYHRRQQLASPRFVPRRTHRQFPSRFCACGLHNRLDVHATHQDAGFLPEPRQ
jgi:hypothetical protein